MREFFIGVIFLYHPIICYSILVYSYVQIQHINPAYKSCTAKLVRRITLTELTATDLYRAPRPHVEQRHSTRRV